MKQSITWHCTDPKGPLMVEEPEGQRQEEEIKVQTGVTEEFQRIFSVPCCLGVDEAGRGPVLGPMVYGIVFCPIDKHNQLKQTGVDDSKKLTESDRNRLFHQVIRKDCQQWLGWSVRVLTPRDISGSMLRRQKYNLNELSHDTAIQLIRDALEHGVNVRQVFVDTVGSPEKYEAKLKSIFPQIPEIAVRKKADSLFPVVSAASICAKVVRDEVLCGWQFDESSSPKFTVSSRDFGSGYPGDSVTKQWLRDNFDSVFGFPTFIRFSWSTAKLLLENDGVPVVWPSEQQEEEQEQSWSAAATTGQKRQRNLADFGIGTPADAIKKSPVAIKQQDGWLAHANTRIAVEL